MIQIKILNKLSQIQTHGAEFPSLEEAEQWIAFCESQELWGKTAKPEVTESQTVMIEPESEDEEENLIPAVYEIQDVVVIEAQECEYDIVIEDVTALKAQEAINAEAQKFLDESDWKVLRHRDQLESGGDTSLTGEEFASLLNLRQAARDSIIK